METIRGGNLRKRENGETFVLVVNEWPQIDGADIEYARMDYDNQGRPRVAFRMTKEGAKKIQYLTSAHAPSGDAKHQLAILMEGRLITAPNII